MNNRYPALLGFILFFTCCATQQKVTKISDWKGRILQFGSGGGFTGVSTVYTLLENGQLFSQTGVVPGEAKELSCVNKKKVKSLFASAATIKWPEERISHPGNLHSTLIYKSDGKEYEITWGDGSYTPPSDVLNLFKDLNSILSPKK